MTDDELIADLLQQLQAADPEVRCEAAGALGALGEDGTAAVEPLFNACRDQDVHVRGEAAHSLWELTGSCVGAVPAAEQLLIAGIPTLIALLDDSSEYVRESAMEVLKRLGPSASAALPRLREVAVGGSPEEAEIAARAIKSISGAGS
jgi:HEAT repeat protein